MAEPQPTYTRDEMDAILKRAIEREQAKSEGISRDELIAAAGEVGISREEVEAAAREIDAQRAQTADDARKRAETQATLDATRARAIRKFWQRAVTYGVLTVCFFLMNLQTHAHWWIWAAIGMGMSLALRASRTFFGDVEEGLSRRDRRRARREARGRDFEARVETGADAILRVVDESRRVRVESREPDGIDRDEPRGDSSKRTSRQG